MADPIVFGQYGLADEDNVPFMLRRPQDVPTPELDELSSAFAATTAAAERGARTRADAEAARIAADTADYERRVAQGRPAPAPSHFGLGLADDVADLRDSPLANEALPEYAAGLSETPAAAPAPGHSLGLERYQFSKRPASERIREMGRFRERGDDTVSVGELARGFTSDVIPGAVEGLGNLFGDEASAAQSEATARRRGDRVLDFIDRRIPGLLDEEYDPTALYSAFVPFADELGGAYRSLTSDDPNATYRREQEQLQSRFERARERSPGSAMVGGLGQGVVLAPFLRLPAAATRTLPAVSSVGQQAAQGALRGFSEGAQLGAITGLDRSHSGVLRQGTDIARGRPTRGLGELGEELGGALLDTASGAGEYGAIGAGFGGAAGAAQGALARRLYGPVATRQNAAEVARIRQAIEAGESAPDAAELGGIMGADEVSPLDEFVGNPLAAEIGPTGRVDASEMVPERNLTVGQMLRDEIAGADPDVSRMRALGMTTVPQLRGARNVFGPRGLSRRADMYGIMREGEIGSTDDFIARAEALRERSGRSLQVLADRARRDGVMVDGTSLADDLTALADRYSAIRDPDAQALGAKIREQATLIRGYDLAPEQVESVVAQTNPRSTPADWEDPLIRGAFERDAGATAIERAPFGQQIGDQARQAMRARTIQEASPMGAMETIPETDFGAMLAEGGGAAPMSNAERMAQTAPRGVRRPAAIAEPAPFPEPEDAVRQRYRDYQAAQSADTIQEPAGLAEDLPEVNPADVTSDEMPVGLADEPMALLPPGSGNRPEMVAREMPAQSFLPWDEMQSIMRSQAGRNRGVYSGSLTNPQEAQRVGTEIYRTMNRARDRAIQQRYGDEALAQYRALRDQYATAATIAPPDRMARAQMTPPTLRRLGGTMTGFSAGASLGAGVGGVPGAMVGAPVGAGIGYATGTVLPRYEHSILAALNAASRGSLADAASGAAAQSGSLFSRVPGLTDLAMRVESALARNPNAFGAVSQRLRDDIARVGTIRALNELHDRDPTVAQSVEASAMDRDVPAAVTDPDTGLAYTDEGTGPMEDEAIVDPDTGLPYQAPNETPPEVVDEDAKDPDATDPTKRSR